MAAYYNENDKFAAAWLRELIKAKLIADGDVDERDIQDVSADDVRGFTQCHFFAGIGGWSYALRLAGWDDNRPVWTGSCPCQPFSGAGARKGGADDRHLWPYWARLIGECRPDTIFGEQVESAITHGWLDSVFDDLEREGYACGAACLPAACVGAPHLRSRLWFVGESERLRQRTRRTSESATGNDSAIGSEDRPAIKESGVSSMADSNDSGQRSAGRRICNERHDAWRREPVDIMGHANGARHQEQRRDRPQSGSSWANCEWLHCRDGKARPTQPGLQPLAYGVSGRVGRLRGYGNAIVPQVAAEFIRAYCEI